MRLAIKDILKKREIMTVFNSLGSALPANISEKFELKHNDTNYGAISVNSTNGNLNLTSHKNLFQVEEAR